VVGKFESTENESFSPKGRHILEYPQYTRPEELKVGKRLMRVPEVLLSGDHAKVDSWREDEALKRTAKRRPDLLKNSSKEE
jgi:tRNA (guanine37-N1)-methyltransferase